MAWHRITNKAGEVQFVASLDGIDQAEWTATPIKGNRSPNEFQDVAEDGSMATDSTRKDKAQKRARFKAMGQDQLADYLEALEARVAALEAKG